MPKRVEKCVLLPVYFTTAPEEEFRQQLINLQRLLGDVAELLPPLPLGSAVPESTDAVVFPQVLGAAYRSMEQLEGIKVPMLIITSEFGTVSMWDWEIAAYMRSEGIVPLAPSSLDEAKTICRALGVKRQLRTTKFLVFQDNPGAGYQPSIFKRFYWWEDECTQRMCAKFGIEIVRRSYRELGELAMSVSDEEAGIVAATKRTPLQDVSSRSYLSAIKLYIAVKSHLDADSRFHAAGMNCLNESHFSDTTPCLAWNLLYEEERLIWGCEADTMTMLTKLIIHRSLEVPIMMTNLYPFIMGQAALKHERIPFFPDIPEPHNCILVAHCGYLGVLPQSMSTEWNLKPKVLAIVNNNATAINARLPEGPITLAKLSPDLGMMSVAEGVLEGYAQYPGSDCVNGGIVRVKNGPEFVRSMASHHYLLTTGHNEFDIQMLGKVFDFGVDVV